MNAPHVFVDRRDGRLALYLNGDLQFDAADERRYHEPLGLVPVGLARARAGGRALSALVLGGGDGLVLRELLRAPDVEAVHLVDRDPEVLALGRGEFAALNGGAFDDPRVRVHVTDARDFLAGGAGRVPRDGRGFDVVVLDLTFPRDVGGASVHTVDFYARVRAALDADGVLAVNAVSPELTPEAFGSVAATLGAVDLSSVPYVLELPSFVAEGYGRWGFFFASARPITDAALEALAFPPGVALTAADVLRGAELPSGAAAVMRSAANRSDEILYYLANAGPLPWQPPFERVRFGPAPVTPGPRLTVAEGFAHWLRQPDGQRSLDALVACLPLGRRGAARQAVLEWAHHAEAIFRGVDLGAFVERVRRRAVELPAAWRREIAELSARVRAGRPTMRELLETTWRVFAVFLLVLLLANLLFPDNLYAKGGSSRSGGSGGEGPAIGFAPTSETETRGFSPRVHSPLARTPYSARTSRGEIVPAAPITFSDPGSGKKPVSAVLALTKDLRLMENGAVALHLPIRGYHFIVHPDRLEIVTTAGAAVMSLHPGSLPDEIRQSLGSQERLVERAMADHRRWLEWTRWAAMLPAGREVRTELDELERIQRAFDRAGGRWRAAPPAAAFVPSAGWDTILPGAYLRTQAGARELVLVQPDGTETSRAVGPPAALTDGERFVFALLHWRATAHRDASLGPAIDAWRAAFPEGLPGGKP